MGVTEEVQHLVEADFCVDRLIDTLRRLGVGVDVIQIVLHRRVAQLYVDNCKDGSREGFIRDAGYEWDQVMATRG